MRFIIEIEADIGIDAENILEATTKAHAMLQALEGVGATRIVKVYGFPDVVE